MKRLLIIIILLLIPTGAFGGFIDNGGGIGGTGTVNRIAIWSDATTLTSDADITFSGVTLSLAATGIIDWGAGDVTLTGGTNTLTFTGGVMKFGVGATDAGLKSVGTTLQVRQGDDAAFVSLKASNLTAGSGAGIATFFSDSSGTTLANIYPLRWSSTGDATAAADLAILRNAAGVAEINSGTAGAFRDLILRKARYTNDAEPACAVGVRGQVVLVEGGVGVADTFRICTKDAADVYAYRALF